MSLGNSFVTVILLLVPSCSHAFLLFRLVEEVKEKCGGIELANEDVYMATSFKEFFALVVTTGRGGSGKDFEYDAVRIALCFDLFINC